MQHISISSFFMKNYCNEWKQKQLLSPVTSNVGFMFLKRSKFVDFFDCYSLIGNYLISSESLLHLGKVIDINLYRYRSIIILLHDNSKPRTLQTIVQKLPGRKLDYEILTLYFLDLAPTGFHLFRNLELFLRQKTFKNRLSIIQNLLL